MERKHFGGIHYCAAANGDHPLEALGQICAERVHHSGSRLAFGIGFQKRRAAGQVERLDIFLIEKFIGENKILRSEGLMVHELPKRVHKHQIGMHFEF